MQGFLDEAVSVLNFKNSSFIPESSMNHITIQIEKSYIIFYLQVLFLTTKKTRVTHVSNIKNVNMLKLIGWGPNF